MYEISNIRSPRTLKCAKYRTNQVDRYTTKAWYFCPLTAEHEAEMNTTCPPPDDPYPFKTEMLEAIAPFLEPWPPAEPTIMLNNEDYARIREALVDQMHADREPPSNIGDILYTLYKIQKLRSAL